MARSIPGGALQFAATGPDNVALVAWGTLRPGWVLWLSTAEKNDARAQLALSVLILSMLLRATAAAMAEGTSNIRP